MRATRFGRAAWSVLGLLAVGLMSFGSAGCNKCIEMDCKAAQPAAFKLTAGRAGGLEARSGGGVRLLAGKLDIPVGADVTVCAGYEIMNKDVPLEGTAMVVVVNGDVALTVDYANETGKKVVSKAIGPMLKPGVNELLVATVVFNIEFDGQTVKTRAGLVVLDGKSKVIDACYDVPDAPYEPIEQTWQLARPGGGQPGNPGGGHKCEPCEVNVAGARWVVGLDNAAAGAVRAAAAGGGAANPRAMREAVAAQIKGAFAPSMRVVSYSPGGGFAVVTGIDADAKAAVGRNGVRYVERDLPVRKLDAMGGPRAQPLFKAPAGGGGTAKTAAGTTPDDPEFPRQAYLPDINAPLAWERGHRRADVRVAVLDTGVAYKLDELSTQVKRGQDFACKRGEDVCDGNGHGTHVAGTILARTNNAAGVAGVAWEGEVLAVRVLDDYGSGHFSDVCDGIRYAVDNGAKVINLSLGAYAKPSEVPQVITDTAKYALDKGVVLVCAAGNGNNDNDGEVRNYPSSLDLPNVVAVLAANTGGRTKASFSDFGTKRVHVGAPGTNILNLSPDGTTVFNNGTSMATPQVAAALAVFWDDLGPANMAVKDRVQKFLTDYTVHVPALKDYCEGGRFLQMAK
ncbi:MAG TPA: S8 family serine peptidase [Tepidisphaeraceae bacterium]|nr:S8 family serine peptidase [Tepidisphaeraceae bacterium]